MSAAGFASSETLAVDYLRDIKPILREKCFACHGALKQEAGLRLDTVAAIRKGGESGTALNSSEPAKSLLLARLMATDPAERMPLQATPVDAKALAKLREWLEHGALGPDHEQPEQDPREHWAFRAPVRTRLPAANPTDRAVNSIDSFIAAEYARHGLVPRPAADRSLLLRRVYLDLIGLPPTPSDLGAFLSDTRPDAYERVVDRLLASPQYGERWARHWMDIWRYADWHGRRHVPDVWNSAPQIWRWRDWIVRSLNEDMGYDRMIAHMLAADEIAPEDDSQTVATGYLIRNWYALNPNDWMRQNVEHTAKAFLGLTFNCAHCHDHKYDPISQQDYFALRAFFEPIGIRQDRVAGEPDPGPFQEYSYSVLRKIVRLGAVRIYDKSLEAPTWFYTGGDERNRVQDKGSIPPSVPVVFGEQAVQVHPVNLPVVAYYPGLRSDIQQALKHELEAAIQLRKTELESARDRVAKRRRELQDAWDRDPEDVSLRQQLDLADSQVTVAEMQVGVAQAELTSHHARYAAERARHRLDPGADAENLARQAHQAESNAQILKAEATIADGSRLVLELELKSAAAADQETAKALEAARKQVADGFAALTAARQALQDPAKQNQYAAFSGISPAQSSGRRRALAEWIGSKTNPLTARVAVNHIWMRHFQNPFVSTVFDFGRNGQPPTHPELLDWLAVELMENGWSMKHLHRLIVTSQTYCLSSGVGDSEMNLGRDPENRYLWRQNVGRLEAEVVRDSLLASAGRLDLRIGGQELENTEALTTHRRTLYYSCQPELDGKSEFGAMFDAPDAMDCYRRTKSIIPQQALALSNSTLVHEVSSTVAEQIWQTLDPSTEQSKTRFVDAAFGHILCRTPREAERTRCLDFLVQHSARQGTPTNGAAGRAALVRVLLNHNDFISVR